ncbi:GntR family transcriptional regulator [Streptomyces bobili]|uniref:GntR family transcriptional regulator n=1 Tax=Streptomyces bobili TaxID=67280 RepID=UPI0033B50005
MSSTPEGLGVRQVSRASLAETVTAEIRRSILAGDLKPGEEFSLRTLAANLGVSVIPVREALRRLEGQGLVVNEQGRSSYVAPLSHEDLHGIYRLRRQLEPEIAARSCLVIEDAELARLAEVVGTFADPRLGVDEVYDAHHNFHLALLAPAATNWDVTTLETLWRAAERYIRLAFSARDAEPTEHSRRGHAHGELLEVFCTRDPDAVTAAVLHHLHDNEEIAQGALA